MTPLSLDPSAAAAAPGLLVVVPDAARREALHAVLSPLAQRLVQAASLAQAQAQLQQGSFSLVVLAAELRDARGGPGAAALRPHLEGVPLLLLGERVEEPLLLEAHAQGAVDLLPWSTSPALLRAKVGALLELSRAAVQGRRFRDVLMAAPTAVVLYRGPRFVVELLNSLSWQLSGGRGEVGRSLFEVVPEVEGSPLHQLLEQVLRTGETVTQSELPIHLDRTGRGDMQEGFFNVVFQPTYDAAGRVDGVLACAAEVTEQVRARRAVEALARELGQSEQRFRALVEATTLTIWTTDPEGHVQQDSPSWRAFTGQSLEQWRGHGWLEAVHPEDRAVAQAAWQRAVETRGLYQADYRLRRHDGEYRDMEVRGVPLLEADGRIREWVGCNMDVSEKRRAERALREQSRLSRAITDNATLGLVMMDARQHCTFMNPAAEKIFGLSFAEVQALDRPLHDVVHHTRPDGSAFPMEDCPIDRALPTRAQEQGEDIFVRPDGTFYPVAFTASPLLEEGVAVGTVLEVRDITERRRAEEALRRSEARYRLATRATNDVIWDWELRTDELTWNEGIESTFGHRHADIPRHISWWAEQVHPEDRERVMGSIHGVLDAGGQHWESEYRFARADGSWALVTDRGFVAHDAAGRPVRMVGAMQDVSARRQAEARLREQSETLETLNSLGSLIAAELDLEKLVQAVTDAATRLTGAQFGAFFYNVINEQGESFMLYTLSGVPREAFSRFPMPRNTAVFHPTFSGQGVVRSDDITKDPRYGKSAPYHGMPQGHLPVRSYLAAPVTSRTGEVVGGLFFGHERPGVFAERAEQLVVGLAAQAAVAMDNARLFREAQGLIRALERSNAELDQFAYVASHDLKAPLRGIANLSQWIEEDLGERLDGETRKQMDLLRGRVTRLEGLIDGILSYSRAGRTRTAPESVDVGRLLQETLELLSPPPGARVELAPQLPVLQAERVPLQQVFINLLGNALKHARRADPHVRVEARSAGEYWEFRVQDNGPGIAPEYHERIWAIFQTLERRDRVEGAGIGLSVVKKIVESRGGRAWVQSAEGQGATFLFTWPRRPAER